MEEKLIGALVGLARATDGDERLFTPTATAFIVQTLNGLPEASQRQLGRAREEKRNIVPNCFQCASPCGRTADYDLQRLHTAPEPVRQAKLRILEALKRLAANFRAPAAPVLYKGLVYIGLEDLPPEAYDAVTQEIQNAIQ